MAKKKQIKTESVTCCYHSKGCYIFIGIILVVLGIVLYVNWLSLEQVAAITLVVMGIKKICMAAKCC